MLQSVTKLPKPVTLAQERGIGTYDPEQASADERDLAERAGQLEIVQALADALVQRRKEAQEYRTLTGIEDDWKEDEEFYDSIDRANPEGETNVGKPVSPEGGPIGIPEQARPSRSTVFIPITRAYVDAASARVGDMLLPTDDSPWSIKPTPVPDKLDMGGAMSPIAAAAGAVAGTKPMPEGAVYAPGKEVPAMDPVAAQAIGMSPDQAAAPAPYSIPMMQQPAVVSDTTMTEEDKAAGRATKVISDWLVECQWHAEVRKCIENAAKYGTGILKGPFPTMRVSQKWELDPATGQHRMTRVSEIVPITKSIHPRNLWVCPSAGEDVQNGSCTFEYDQIGSRKIRALLEDPTYIPEMLQQVLREGPKKAYAENPEQAENLVEVGATYPVWYFYGDIDRNTLLAAGIPEDDFPDDGDYSMPAMIMMINDRVVKAMFNPLESGGFPYDIMPWQRRTGMVWGKGVARQIRTPQRMLNAAVRSMMDNAGLTSGPIWAIRSKWVRPIDGKRELSPRKGFEMTEDAPQTAKIQDAISFENIQSNINEINLVIDRAMKFAEDATGLPMLMQGQQGSAPDTVGGMTILNNNGSTVLRRIARLFDDNVTERHIRRYYFWLLENEGNDDAKGDFQIDARGSTALVERDLQNQALNNLAPLLLQMKKVNPDKLGEELIKANRLDPKAIMYTEDEWKKIQEQPTPPPLPQLIQELKNQGAMALLMARLKYEAERGQATDTLEEARIQSDWELGLGKLSMDMGISQDKLKTLLAQTAMKLDVQVREGNANRAGEVISPAAEPAGRAPEGEAFAA